MVEKIVLIKAESRPSRQVESEIAPAFSRRPPA
jgi:hypothetical protein